MAKVDTHKLLSENPPNQVVGKYVRLKKQGPHYKGKCPFHQDEHASLTVTPNKGEYGMIKCFACNWSGDVIKFVQDYSGLTFREACKSIQFDALEESNNATKRISKPKKKAEEWKQIIPAPDRRVFKHYIHGQPNSRWIYKTPKGEIIGHVCRFDLKDGGKEVLPYIYASNGKKKEWRWKGFDKPRPLYNLDLLAQYPESNVILVEGEKTADAANAQLDPNKSIATTWLGGSNAIRYVDWDPIKDRSKVLWPDNDVQGLSAMLHIDHLIGSDMIIPLDNTLPKGWDCADKEWKPNELREFVLKRMVESIPSNTKEGYWKYKQIGQEVEYQFGLKDDRWFFEKVEQKEAKKTDIPANFNKNNAGGSESPQAPKTNNDHESYFKILGYDKNENGQQQFYFLSKGSYQVIKLSASSISANTLLQIAPLSYWEKRFYGKRPFDVTSALNWIIAKCNRMGPFKEKYIRGRGAWMDEGKVTIHAGSKLIINGKDVRIGSVDSKYIYEIDEDLHLQTDNPLKTRAAHKILDLLKRLHWERDINAYLLAGWCIVAPVCGTLTWRPHIWLTGAAGTGKSWVFNKLIRRLLGDAAVSVQGETSEAGLRQALRNDALPIVFDEAEGNDRRATERMQQVLALMRASSAEDGGALLKGSAGGSGKRYVIRSCFAFASIAVQIKQASDRSRVSVLGLSRYEADDKEEKWIETQRIYNNLITDEYCQGLQARTVSLLPVILENAKTFANAAAAELGQQRAGDQLGALLAGAYSLTSTRTISFDKAIAWIREKDWSEERGYTTSSDEKALLECLLDQPIQLSNATGQIERNLSEFISVAIGKRGEKYIDDIEASQKIGRLGFKIKDNMLVVSNTAQWIKRKLYNTAWPENHNKILIRIPGAEKVSSTRFANGLETRGVAIPLEYIFGERMEGAVSYEVEKKIEDENTFPE